MECTLDAERYMAANPFKGDEAAWIDAYSRVLGARQPSVPVEACMGAARTALAAYGPGVHPQGAAFLDVELGPLQPRSS